MTKRTKKRPDSVVDMVRKLLPEDKEFVGELEQQSGHQRLVSQLAVLRNRKGISQDDVAEQCNCNQSRISKLENGFDEDVLVGDLKAYAKLTGHDVTILFTTKGSTLVEQVKYFAMCMKDAFDRMNELAVGDPQIAKGVAKFHLEALFNLVSLVSDASQDLRLCAGESEPRISLQVAADMILGRDDKPEVNQCASISLAENKNDLSIQA